MARTPPCPITASGPRLRSWMLMALANGIQYFHSKSSTLLKLPYLMCLVMNNVRFPSHICATIDFKRSVIPLLRENRLPRGNVTRARHISTRQAIFVLARVFNFSRHSLSRKRDCSYSLHNNVVFSIIVL